MSQITWADKVTLDAQPDVARINKVIDDDMNEIKSAHNDTDSQVSGLTAYSTTDNVIGKWVNNKPIYRRCIYIASFPNSTTANIDVSNLNIDYIVNLYGYAKVDNSRGFPINNARPDTNMDSCIGVWYDTTLKISTGLDRSNCSGYIIIEYTKTTD